MEKINVLYCPVGRQCEMVEIENNMGAIQRLVGCDELEIAKPWSQDVGVIVGAGTNADKRKNRWLYREDGGGACCRVCGAFVVVFMPRNCDVLLPLPPMFADRYSKLMELCDEQEGGW